MHYTKVKGILSSKNGMNLYRGCLHGCIYCDARSTCYQMPHAFEDIEIKENALELLEYSLQHKRKKCMLGMGAMSDPYIPLETELQHTRQALSLAAKYGFGFTLITKSAHVLRDIDLLQAINAKAKCVVQMTLTTYDEQLCRRIEPHVSTTKERFAALKELQAAGIPTVVWLCPILPFINDTADNIHGILDYCIQAKVYGIICFGMGLTLRSGNREYFYQQLDKHWPGLKEKYSKTYGSQYILNSPHGNSLMQLFRRTCSQHGIVHDNTQIFKYLNTLEEKSSSTQLSLF